MDVLCRNLLRLTPVFRTKTDSTTADKVPTEVHNGAVLFRFYRAMHFSAKRGIAIACRLSVRPSVCDVGEL